MWRIFRAHSSRAVFYQKFEKTGKEWELGEIKSLFHYLFDHACQLESPKHALHLTISSDFSVLLRREKRVSDKDWLTDEFSQKLNLILIFFSVLFCFGDFNASIRKEQHWILAVNIIACSWSSSHVTFPEGSSKIKLSNEISESF